MDFVVLQKDVAERHPAGGSRHPTGLRSFPPALDGNGVAEIASTLTKHAPGYVEENPAPMQLDEAYRMLSDRTLRGLQLRYLHQGITWWDTIMPQPGGLFRIVRIEHHFPLA